MSRAAGGTYTLPAGNPVITGTVISSTWANTTLTDIATALTDSLSRSGLGGMTASLQLPDGSAALPSLNFTNSTTTGLYRGGADILGFSTAGVSRGTISAAGNWVIPTPTSGTALDISSTANDVIILRKSGTIYGYLTADGTGTGLFTGANETGYGYYATPTGLSLQANNAIRLTINSTGNVTIAAPSSGVALTTNSTGNDVIIQQLKNSAATWAGEIYGGTANGMQLGSSTNHQLQFYTNNLTRLLVAAAGNVTINAPSSGTTLTANGLTGSNTFILGSTGAASTLNTAWNVILGASWNIFTQSTDPLNIGTTGAAAYTLSTNSAARLVLSSTGSVTMNAQTSGAGMTINAAASTPVNAIGNSSTAFTIDFSKSNVHTVTMTGNVPGGSLTLSNAQDGQTINVFLTQDGTGTRTLGYPASVKWLGGTVGVLSTAINTVDILTLTFRSSTGFYYATLSKAFS